jgi:hypothetical protein
MDNFEKIKELNIAQIHEVVNCYTRYIKRLVNNYKKIKN